MSDKKATSLCDLPTEIQHLIVLNLHPSAAIALKRTNRWFNAHISLRRLDQQEVFRFLSQHEELPKFSKNSHHGKRPSFLGYACYTCLTIKPAQSFSWAQVTGDYAKRNDPSRVSLREEQRCCIDCGLRHDRFNPAQVLKLGDGRTLNLFCPACQSLQAYFCAHCRFCVACIAKSKWWTGKIWRHGHTNQSGVTEIVRPCQVHL